MRKFTALENVNHIIGGLMGGSLILRLGRNLLKAQKIIKVELRRPGSLFFEFDTGMVSYVCSEKPLQFDFNLMQGYEFLSSKALDIYLKRMMERLEAEQREKTVKEKYWIKRCPRKEEV